MNEEYSLLTGKWLSDTVWAARATDYGTGTPVTVQFDPQQVISREVNHRDVIGFYHTHPSFPGSPSSTDYATMDAWVDCLGKPLICLIDGIDGLKTYYWLGESSYIIGKSYKFEEFFFGSVKK